MNATSKGDRAPDDSSRMLLIDCCRGLAAFLVVFQHCLYMIAEPKYFGTDPLNQAVLFGGRGVDFFFVLSGFVISFAHWGDLGRTDRLGRYLTKRFTRVYPLLWVVAIPSLCASWVLASAYVPAGWQENLNVAFTSLTLLPSQYAPQPNVAWTLKHEILFYALFAVVLWRPRLGLGMLLAWAAACIAYATTAHTSNFLTDFLLSSYNLEFLVGITCGWILRTRRVPCPLVLSTVGAIGFFAAGLAYDPPPVEHPWIPNPTTNIQLLYFGLSSALVILGLAQINLSRPIVPPRVLVLLGAASYSIYLVHVPVVSVACKVLVKMNSAFPVHPLAALAVTCAAGVVGGIVLHLGVERPLMKMVRRVLPGDRRRAGAAAPQSPPQAISPPAPLHPSISPAAALCTVEEHA